MKRKDLLLVTFLLSQTVPVWAMDPPEVPTERPHSHNSVGKVALNPNEDPNLVIEVEHLQRSLLNVISITKTNAIKYKDLEQVVVIGLSGSGKSTTINLLAEKHLIADRGKLDTISPILGSEIGHDYTSKTTLPSPWEGPDGRVYWDCPGFEDSKGAPQDIVNMAIREIFSGKIKILLAVKEEDLASRPNRFIKLINNVTKIFSVDELKKNLAIVITKQGKDEDVVAYEELQKMLKILPGSNTDLFTPDVQTLLTHLEKNKETLISYFPAPVKGVCDLETPRKEIFRTIACLDFVENPTVHSLISPEAMIYIMNLAGSLNKEVENSLHLMRPTMINLCKTQAENWLNPESLENLKTQKESLLMSLRSLEAIASDQIENFVIPLNLFITDPQLRNQHLHSLKARLQLLSFLKELTDEVKYAKAEWSEALQTTLDEMHKVVKTLSKTLGNLLTFHLKETIIPKMTNFCSKVLDETSDEEQKIAGLSNVLNILKTALDSLPHNREEEMTKFSHSFTPFFDLTEENVLKVPMQSLTFLKTFQEGIEYPAGLWSELLQPSVNITQSMIEDRQRLLQAARVRAAQEEAARIERERAEAERQRLVAEHQAQEEASRREREEVERRAEEQRQVQAAEIARLAEAAAAAEHQRLADLDTQRQAHVLLQQQIEQQRIQAAEVELQRQAEAARVAAVIEAERQRFQQEIARQKAEFQEYQHLIKLAADAEAERRGQEAARIEAARIAAEQELAAQRAVEAERQRLLNLPNGTEISLAQYNLLPEGYRCDAEIIRGPQKGQLVYYKGVPRTNRRGVILSWPS